jgi:hypothetical protein
MPTRLRGAAQVSTVRAGSVVDRDGRVLGLDKLYVAGRLDIADDPACEHEPDDRDRGANRRASAPWIAGRA